MASEKEGPPQGRKVAARGNVARALVVQQSNLSQNNLIAPCRCKPRTLKNKRGASWDGPCDMAATVAVLFRIRKKSRRREMNEACQPIN
jgi:hypothetical protein